MTTHNLLKFAHFYPPFQVCIQELTRSIEEELIWRNSENLGDYMRFTFTRLMELKRVVFISYDGKRHENEDFAEAYFAVYNTGLKNNNDKKSEVFAIFERTRELHPDYRNSKKWLFKKFEYESDEDSSGMIKSLFGLNDNRPIRASYTEFAKDFIYNHELELNANFKHILEHSERLPDNFIKLVFSSRNEFDEAKREFLSKTKVKNEIQHKQMLKIWELKKYFDDKVKVTEEKTRDNYLRAVPMYYKSNQEKKANDPGKISLMLPLNLGSDDTNEVDAVLVTLLNTRPDGKQYYYGITIYPIHWARVHARVVNKWEFGWISLARI